MPRKNTTPKQPAAAKPAPDGFTRRTVSQSFSIPIYVLQEMEKHHPKGEQSTYITRLVKNDLGIA
jgi:hypothetical protein